MNGTKHYVHRVSLQLAGVDLPPNMDVLHSCDNPGCCNPSHLSVGTHQDNMLDAFRKGRLPTPKPLPGTKNFSAKLTPAQVIEIRKAMAAGETQQSISKRFGIAQSHAHRIKSRHSWSSLS